ncbi:hypothetical protein [Campylobacter helveticus]|uniref:Uncharacterized protein n=1 Tax=Campylobacter helveticus TaxID=28898 RepID=A0AAX2UKS9_9BACT|nr:hypothetical protein [Campylobacter helveticus]ARE81075.1 hypothetical protein CHELV3228_1506 [Campylobacter helveticus]MCR2038931.1 hypothetical protein [Campylobacter helveticus]MCR2054094.1 hypothetical protein [Campylobacter helveticus]MCR2055998.1 hypothetical protein [Campylobacter helveticus]MCR2059957.1 hypothetical protein [Campylobacter helveticus]
MEINLFQTRLKIEFEEFDEGKSEILNEYANINVNSRLVKWKKLSYKVDFEESERVIFDLLLSLKEDIIRIENHLFNQEELLTLKHKTHIKALNFEYLEFLENLLENGKDYYARFELNNQKIAFFFKSQSENLAKITKMKPEDLISYNAFVVETQRNAIREKKEANG